MTIQEKFYEKLLSEYNAFLDSLREMQPDRIISFANEKVMKEEILHCFADLDYLSDEEAVRMIAQKVDLDDLYNNYTKMDVSLGQMIADCNDFYVQEMLSDLPGQEVDAGNNYGYDIKRAVLFDNDRGFAFAHNPNAAASPYVTWQVINDNGKFDCYWGNYYNNESYALLNFVERANEYALTNNINEQPLPDIPPQLPQEEWRTYRANLTNPEEPEYPLLEVFGASNDADAFKQAHDVCEGRDGVHLLELYELDEDYNTIRQIDLKYHDPSRQRFMNVDLIDFLGQIADKTIIHYPQDFKFDVENLWEIAISDNPAEQRQMWYCSTYGSQTLNEDEVFTKDTGAYGYWVNYRPKEPSMVGYVVEVTGYKNLNSEETVVGNVFDVGKYYPHSLYVKENALTLDSVSLTYSAEYGGINAGKTITVPRLEYDNDHHRLMSESGFVTAIKYQPYEGTRTMAALLKYEHDTRMAMPIGDPKEQIK